MAHFAVTLVHGPAWDDATPIRGQRAWEDHAQFMDDLVDTGFLIIGGPVGDGSETLHAVCAEDPATVRGRFARDPWARASLLEVGSVRPWSLWLDGRTRAAVAVPDAPTRGLDTE